MKLPYSLKKIITTSWFLAAVPAFILIIYLPPFGSRYKLLIEEPVKPLVGVIYDDLNSDNKSEIIYYGKGVPYYYLVVGDYNGRVYDQWNLKDNVDPAMSEVFTGNFDNDFFKEIYIFTNKGDSLFININEFFEKGGTKLERVYITEIGVVNGTVTSIIKHAGFFDIDGDGKKELYFSIHTGFGLEPRRLYYFDITRKVLKISSFIGVICQNPKMTDIDGDNKPEIFGIMGASGNYRKRPPFTDSSTWFMVFNENLSFEFPPAEFPGLTNMLDIKAYKNTNFKGYLLAHYTGSADTSIMKPRMMLYTTEGKLKRDRPFSDLTNVDYPVLTVNHSKNGDRIYLLGPDLLELNEKLEVINKLKSPLHTEFNYLWADINFDSDDELLLYSEKEKKLVICQASLRKIAEAEIITDRLIFNISLVLLDNNEKKMVLTSSNNAYFLTLKKNDYYILGFMAYPGVYFLLVFCIKILNKINTVNVVQKESLKRRLITLQLQGIKTQLDPHFTFNALNSIASLVYLEDKEAAYDYLTKFTELLRGMLNDAERVYRSLGEEVDFVKTYFDLEKLRFGDKFNYEFQIGKEISYKEQVPKLVLQTFAENAIKHGIMSRTEGGVIKIIIDKIGDNLKLTIEDNGIGREGAAGLSTSTGKGLKLTSEFYDILNQLNKKPITHTFIDLYNESGVPSGTRVDVLVPLEIDVR